VNCSLLLFIVIVVVVLPCCYINVVTRGGPTKFVLCMCDYSYMKCLRNQTLTPAYFLTYL
jgi:hypothetical protein